VNIEDQKQRKEGEGGSSGARRKPARGRVVAKEIKEDPIPTTPSEALLRLLWPFRKYPIGTIAIVLWLIIGGLYYVTPEGDRVLAIKNFYHFVVYYFSKPSKLAVVLPKNLYLLNLQDSSIRNTIALRTGISDVVFVGEDEIDTTKADGILYINIDLENNNLKGTLSVFDAHRHPIEQVSDTIPSEYVSDASQYFIDGSLNSLNISWNNFTTLIVPHHVRPTAFALVEKARDIQRVSSEQAIALVRSALALDSKFAAGYWTLGTLLKAGGQSKEAEDAFTTAVRIDPEVPKIWPDSDPTEALERTLGKLQWEEIGPGLSVVSALQPEYEISIWAWKLDSKNFTLRIVEEDHETGENVDWLRAQTGLVLGFNGGFFEKDQRGRLTASGLIITEGIIRSRPWSEKQGGVLAVKRDGSLEIVTASAYPFEKLNAAYAIQSKPVMIEPGGKWAMLRDDHDMQHRTALCLERNGNAIVVIVGGQGISAFELATLLQRGRVPNIFDCDSAIALDGGPSTQAYFEPRKTEIPGGWNMHDAIVITKKTLTK
jgi:uncharacterized protein YigE (DUF2233 family)